MPKTVPARFKSSLKIKAALGIFLPLLLASAVLVYINYKNERNYLHQRTLLGVANVGKIVLASLRPAMLDANQAQVAEQVMSIGSSGRIQKVVILALDGSVKLNSDQTGEFSMGKDAPGCVECHKLQPSQRPQAIFLNEQESMIRIVVPIMNEPACYKCHDAKLAKIGVLLVDNAVSDMQQYLQDDLLRNTLISLFGIFFLMIGVYISSHWLVVSRLERMRKPLANFADGDFSTRIGDHQLFSDEISELTWIFDDLAERLQKHEAQLIGLNRVKAKAITEERERIARELHDGVAQLLGYVTNKTSAIRILLENNQVQAARTNLSQLESASQQVFLDLREAILGLRMSSRVDESLDKLIKEYSSQFTYLSDLAVTVELKPDNFNWQFNGDLQLELFRITQESLHNIRKHACASRITIQLSAENERFLYLIISDDGVGFNLAEVKGSQGYHFGLESMVKRAQLIEGKIEFDSNIGYGTRIKLHVPIVR